MISSFLYTSILKCSAIFLLASFITSCEIESDITSFDQQERDEIIINEYLELNNIDASKTESGLYYSTIHSASPGALPPSDGDYLTVHYTGWLLYGEIFDSSVFRDSPLMIQSGTGKIIQEFDEDNNPKLSGTVIPGWIEGLSLVKEGEQVRFFIPSHLAYGVIGQLPAIPPNAILVFDIELIEVQRN